MEWWKHVAGLKPPSKWNVSGALDVLPHLSTKLSLHQKRHTKTILDGAIHDVTNVWHEETLAAIRSFIHGSNFWCSRTPDAWIRAFGGPYVLGQTRNDLKLIHGAIHTELTGTLTREQRKG